MMLNDDARRSSLSFIPTSMIRGMLILLILTTLFTVPAIAQSEVQPEYKGDAADSTEFYRKKYSSKKTWEHIVSLPATIVSLPLVLFFKAQEGIVGYIYDEKLIPRAKELVTSADGQRKLSPKFSNRSGYGVKITQRGIFNSESALTLTATGSINSRQRYRIELEDVRLGGPVYSNFRARYRKLPDESFFGLGPESMRSEKSFFTHEYATLEGGLNIKATAALSLQGIVRWDQNNVFGSKNETRSAIDLYNRSEVAGLQTGVKVIQYHGGLLYDSRNRRGNPNRGYEMKLSGTLFQDTDDGPFNFRKVAADITRYIHFGHNRVLALRVAAETTRPSSDGDQIPFYFLSELGYRDTIRGFDRGRFRDRDLAIGSAEYRIPLWHRMDSFFFVDAGHVGNNISEDFSTDLLNFGYGGGIRIWNDDDVKAVLQFAVSKERFRIYFNLN